MSLLSFGCLAERLKSLVSWSSPSSGKVRGTSTVLGVSFVSSGGSTCSGCMLLRLFPFFSLMLPLYVNMQGNLFKEFCIPDHPFPGLHLDQLKGITSFLLQDYIVIPLKLVKVATNTTSPSARSLCRALRFQSA